MLKSSLLLFLRLFLGGVMKSIIRLAVVIALSIGSPSLAQLHASPVPTTGEYSFDADAYTRLRVVMNWTEASTTNVFTANFCPKNELMGLKLIDLVKGDKSAALTVAITAPQIEDANLNLYNININRKLFAIDCEASFQRIDFKSPLYLGGQYDGSTVSITPKIVVAEKPSQLFDESLAGLLAAANAISPLPAPFLDKKDKVIKRLAGQFSSTVGVSDTIQFNIGSSGLHSEEWTIPGNTSMGVPSITVKAYLEAVPSYFTKPASGWSPSNILTRVFPSGAQFGYANFGAFVAGLGGNYANMIAANDVGVFDARCQSVQTEIAGQGFTPMDRSLLLWAVTQSQANLRSDPRIDHTDCLKSVFAELARFDQTKDLLPRNVILPPADLMPATEQQMRSTIESDARLAVFLRANSWVTRRAASEGLFSWPMKFVDHANTNLLTSSPVELQNSDQWQTLYAGDTVEYASRAGCYLFRPGGTESASRLLAIIDFGTDTEPVERLISLTFADAASETTAATVRQFDIIDQDDAEEELALIRSRHSSGCGASSWKPAILGF